MNQGHTLRHNTTAIGQEVSLLRQTYNAFVPAEFAAFIERTERIASALYVVTLHLPDSEAIVPVLRRASASLLDTLLTYVPGDTVSQKRFLETLLSELQRCKGHLTIAAIAELISQRNAALLEREILQVHGMVTALYNQTLQSETRRPSERSLDSLFSELATAPSVSAPVATPVQPMPAMSDRVIPQSVAPAVIATESVVPQRPIASYTATEQSLPAAGMSRQMDILSLVKELRTISIKDIVDKFPDVSEKTIQRDLQSLVNRSVLKKTGERRWAKYSLI